MVVTFNIRDCQSAKESLGLRVLTPVQLLGVSWSQLVYLPALNTCSAVSFKFEKVGEMMV